jgi:nitrogenase molybdenum-iron protein alpha chain
VRFLPCYSDADDFQYALESALNVSICGTHDDYFIEHLKTLYDIPFLIDTIPIGRKNTSRWLMKIAEHFGLQEEARRFTEAENKALDDALEPFRSEFSGKTAFLAGGEVRIIATAEILQDVGIQVVGFKGHHYDKFAEPIFDSLEDVSEVVFNVATQQPHEMVNLVKQLQPDLLVSHTGGNNISAKLGLPLLPLFGPSYNYMGYSGVFEVARRTRRILKNAQFNKKLAEHCALPYRASWYGRNPFAYIKKDG